MSRYLLVLLIVASCFQSVFGQPAHADTTSYVRLIFIANCFTAAENSAFKYAAANLVADYERDSDNRAIVKRIYFDNARQIVDSINHQRLVIKSVDFLSHSRDDRIGATITRGKVQYRTSLFATRQAMQEARVLTDAEGAAENLRNSPRMACIEEIDFSHFSYDAVVEIHGCHAGAELDSLPANICRRMSLALYMSGKQLAVAIGHGTRANPNTVGGAHSGMAASGHGGAAASAGPGFKESVLAQDYRHGLRLVYFDGRTVLATRVPGALPQSAIIAAIVQAANGSQRPGRR